jgi:hypothetical protein
MRIIRPAFGDREHALLGQIERMLEARPYMRVDLGGTGPTARELERVLSARLGLMHAERRAEDGSVSATLSSKLRAFEAELVARMAREDGARLRYETLRLLHPEPDVQAKPSMSITEATRAWEALRSRRPVRALVAEKLTQNRDFFRHGAMLPFYWLRRRRIRRLLPDAVRREPALAETFSAIEQVGPLVDNFAFKGAARVPGSTSVAIADFAFFYMQLADELLDELAAAAGGHHAVGAFVQTMYRHDLSSRPLCDLEVEQLSALGVDPNAHTTKFGITLAALFESLSQTAAVIDRLLGEADPAVVDAAHLFLHHCFQTYLDEAALSRSAGTRRIDRLPLEHTAWHFYRKNNLVMMLWLDLRARLLGLQPSAHQTAIHRWGYLLASFQIFDDLKDIALDLRKQPSYPLQIAANELPAELTWLEQRFGSERRPLTRDEVAEVTLNASGTVQQCMRWSRLIALAHFDNALLYAWDQRWRKSWTRRRRSFNPESARIAPRAARAADRLVHALGVLRDRSPTHQLNDAQLAFALDASAYDGAADIYWALFPNFRAMYRFATLRMWMTAEEKARAARRLLRKHGRGAVFASVGFADANVDHQVGGDLLEAVAEPIEVERLRRAKPGHRLEQGAA